MRRLLLLLLVVPALAAAASGGAATPTAVSITSTGFHPANVIVPAGDAVTWTNADTANHQVVADNGSFSSPVLSSKQSFSHTFRSGGTFAYHDALRPARKGSVAVVPVRTVWIMSSGFVPPVLSIRIGQTVTWVNRTTSNQQVTANDASFASPVLAAGASFTHTFLSVGTFGYHDGLKPALTGSVVVTTTPPAEELSLESNADTVTYGGSVMLTGTVANGTAGEKVTVTGRPQGLKTAQSIQTATAGSDGSFSITVKPIIHTAYTASTGKTTSDPLTIDVRPLVRLAHFDSRRAVVRVSAARSMLHRFVLLQAWHPRTHVWSTIRRVRLTTVTAFGSPTVTTRSVFALRVRHGLRLRAFIPFSQAQPGYVPGASNAIRS